MKYILVTGGVISGVGKGVIASSTGVLLRSYGLKVTSIKIDPYLNIDAGTLAPFDHGEVFVLDDGGEVDLDLGNYERFLNVTLTSEHNITTGKIYQSVIQKEGDYLGKTVQVVPHITDAIQNWVERVAQIPVDSSNETPDVCIVELGGTVGDIESAPFVEAMRQFQFKVGRENFFLIHVSLVPFVGEQKTKPTQSSVRDLRGLGLSPDAIACRSAQPLEKTTSDKIAMFCHVPPQNVFAVHDVSSVYHVPLLLESQGLLQILQSRLCLASNLKSSSYLTEWKEIVNHYDNMDKVVKIAMVGKYTALRDSYLSVIKALQHATVFCDRKLEILWIEATDLEESTKSSHLQKWEEAWELLKSADGLLVPGGFGERGTLGMILACKYARENALPFLGICLGLQVAVIEFARSVLGLSGANSEEFDQKTPNRVVVFMPEISKTQMGGTMRLGLRATRFVKQNSKTQKLYGGVDAVHERHRHRYEVNIKYVPQLEEKGLKFVGHDELGERMEILELDNHPYYVAVQYHPEFTSRPVKPSPVFTGLINAAIARLDSRPYYAAVQHHPELTSRPAKPSPVLLA